MNLRIALLAGDGIGPEITAEARRTLDRTAERFGHRFEYREAPVGAAAIDLTGDPYPEETHRICLESDAVLFGAIGDPKYDNDPTAPVRPEQGLLRMRRSLGLYANLRPVAVTEALIDRSPLKPEIVRGTDFICVRELTGGIYFGRPQGRDQAGTRAFDTCTYTVAEIERVLHTAFRLAGARRRRLRHRGSCAPRRAELHDLRGGRPHPGKDLKQRSDPEAVKVRDNGAGTEPAGNGTARTVTGPAGPENRLQIATRSTGTDY